MIRLPNSFMLSTERKQNMRFATTLSETLVIGIERVLKKMNPILLLFHSFSYQFSFKLNASQYLHLLQEMLKNNKLIYHFNIIEQMTIAPLTNNCTQLDQENTKYSIPRVF